jgi:hypothetical protein
VNRGSSHGKARSDRRASPAMHGAVAAIAVAAVGTLGLFVPAAGAAGDANEVACPSATESSPGFRAYLPDCRAYELVTPPYTGGTPPLPIVARSPDGEGVLALDISGVFAGSENDPFNGFGSEGALYGLARGASGWGTEALDPPGTLYPKRSGVRFEAASVDLAVTLWSLSSKAAEEAGEGASLYLRNGGGTFNRVGPASPVGAEEAFHVAGASQNLSDVLAYPGAHWPGDTTIRKRRSLYEYAYAGASLVEPLLVGVDNEGGLGSNRDANLITQCGTSLGSLESGDVYNALSASGKTVFFTARAGPCELGGETGTGPAVDELYARVGGAHTVAISEPPLSGAGAVPGRECTLVCQEDEEEQNGHSRSKAIFQGASEDGGKVFFLSDQPLVNADQNTTMDLYMAELAGEGREAHIARLVLVSEGEEIEPHRREGAEVQGVARVSENGERVYFVAKGVLTTKPDQSLAAGQQSAVKGQDNLYVYDADTGKLAFVATLASSDEESGLGSCAYHVCDWATEDERTVQASEDGKYLIFLSHAHLTAGDTSSGPQLFEYDAQTETVVRASIGQRGDYLCPTSGKIEEGYNCDGNLAAYEPELLVPQYSFYEQPWEPATRLEVAEDGTLVFSSKLALTPNAVSGYPNSAEPQPSVYEYEKGEVYLISDGQDTNRAKPAGSAVTALGIDNVGTDIFFTTADGLVPQDGNTEVDVYDARVNGGFSAEAQPGDCAPECQGQPASFSPTPSATSAYTESGNLVPLAKTRDDHLTRGHTLRNALKACAKRYRHSRHRRRECKRQVRRFYTAKVSHARRHRGRGRQRGRGRRKVRE